MAEAAQKTRWTRDELLARGLDPKEYEILNGEPARVKSLGMEGGHLWASLGSRLHVHVEANRLGRIYVASRFLFREEPRRERRPDLAFVSKERIAQGDPDMYSGVPDLLVEILSPSDPTAAAFAKTRDDLEDGVREVWVVDPLFWAVMVMRKGRPPRPLGVGDVLETPVIPGLRLSLEELFRTPSP